MSAPPENAPRSRDPALDARLKRLRSAIDARDVLPRAEVQTLPPLDLQRPLFVFSTAVPLLFFVGMLLLPPPRVTVLVFLIPLLFPASMLVAALRRDRRRAMARLQAVPAVLTDKRTEIVWDRMWSKTTHFVTLATTDAADAEYIVDMQLYPHLRAGDAGVAWIRADLLRGFDRREI